MTSNKSYEEVSNLVIGIAGSVCAPIVFALLGVVVCACIQGIQDHFSAIDPLSNSHCIRTFM